MFVHKALYKDLRTRCGCCIDSLAYYNTDQLTNGLYLAQIGTNGIVSFDQPVYSPTPVRFPSNRNDIRNLFLVAPFWADIDIRDAGDIFYEVHTAFSSGDQDSSDLMSQVDDYIQGETGQEFSGSWMLVVQWDMVHPWPHGESNPFFCFFLPGCDSVGLQAYI